MSISEQALLDELEHGNSRPWRDWAYLALLTAASGAGLWHYGAAMDGYEQAISIGSAISLGVMALRWRAIQSLSIAVLLLCTAAFMSYQGDLARAESAFWLRYVLSSQSAIMWMSALFVMSTLAYYWGLLLRSEFSSRVGSALSWCATAMGLVGLVVRWRESYLIHPDYGHIPVSNLYEVFILFAVITALLYLHYESSHQNRRLGAFALTVISAAVAFLLWYQFSRGADEILPLVPALNSYWMKIHVPANFIGYGAFAVSAMMACAYLLRQWSVRRFGEDNAFARQIDVEMVEDVMYKSIALGFAFFTLATVLGALWAAEAWGGYWSWDPKETWALIVWLNYAAWLHLKLSKGWRGAPMAWWSVVGLFVTLFAFLGVNMFLSGLHSYGGL